MRQFWALLVTSCALPPAAAPAAPPAAAEPAPEAPARTTPTVADTSASPEDVHDHDDEPDLDPATTPADGMTDVATFGPTPPPASRYAALDQAACETELKKRTIAFKRVDTARGVVAPVRLDGPLSGVTFRWNLAASQRKTAVMEIYDCRLVLALDDFAKILARHDVTEVIHLSVYRQCSKAPQRRVPERPAAVPAAFHVSISAVPAGSRSGNSCARPRLGARGSRSGRSAAKSAASAPRSRA
jgi:hypothetical protein